jgi:hypothetical protein
MVGFLDAFQGSIRMGFGKDNEEEAAQGRRKNSYACDIKANYDQSPPHVAPLLCWRNRTLAKSF